MPTSRYPIRSFEDIFVRIDRRFEIEDDREYDCLGIRLDGNGPYIRETKLGATIKRKRQWSVKKGDVLYNKLFAWRGAFAIADESVDGCIASDKFPAYRVDHDKVSIDYLRLFFRSRMLSSQAEEMSKGAAALSKYTLNPPDFPRLRIPLPSLSEQAHIVRRADRLLRALNRIRELRAPIDAVVQGRRAGVGSEVRLLMSAALRRLNEAVSPDSLGVLDDVLIMKPRSGPSFPCSEDGAGFPVIMPSALGGFRYDTEKCLFGNGTESVTEKDFVEKNDLLISRGNKRDQVGLCIVYEDDERRTYANLLMRMKVDTERVLPHFVKYWIMSPLAVNYIRDHTRGTSPAIQKINQRNLINLPFPNSFTTSQQTRWVSYLDRIFERVEHLESLARSQHESVENMVRSVIEHSFL